MVRADIVEKKIARAAAWLDSCERAYARPRIHAEASAGIDALRRFMLAVAATTDDDDVTR